MAVVLQGNLHRSSVAHDLLDQMCYEKQADIIIISEQYRSRDDRGWYSDVLGTAAIWIPDRKRIYVASHGSGSGFIWVRCDGVYYVSVYLTPNEPISEFQAKLDSLENTVRDWQDALVVAGGFNAKDLEWRETRSNSRGKRVMDMAPRLGLVVLYTGSTSTFRRPGYKQTTIVVSLASEYLAGRIEGWRVIKDLTGSDHQYITLRVRDIRPVLQQESCPLPRWNIAKMDIEKLSMVIEHG